MRGKQNTSSKFKEKDSNVIEEKKRGNKDEIEENKVQSNSHVNGTAHAITPSNDLVCLFSIEWTETNRRKASKPRIWWLRRRAWRRYRCQFPALWFVRIPFSSPARSRNSPNPINRWHPLVEDPRCPCTNICETRDKMEAILFCFCVKISTGPTNAVSLLKV